MVYDPETVESIEEIDSCNDYEGTELILKGLPKLKSIEIGEECFLTTRTFELDGLNALESGDWQMEFHGNGELRRCGEQSAKRW